MENITETKKKKYHPKGRPHNIMLWIDEETHQTLMRMSKKIGSINSMAMKGLQEFIEKEKARLEREYEIFR